MRFLRSLPVRSIPAIAFILFSSMTAVGQTPSVPARVTQPVDVEQLVTLQGNTHPLARSEFDQGIAPDSLPMERILLVLQRSAEQDAALQKLLEEQQTKSSPNFHTWLTPEQFGQQFGPADADIQAVTDWLTSQGFQVNRVAAGRTVIEFSGTAGTVRQAFHTEIHKFAVHGAEHWANASDPQIPAALRPVVAGFASLNNFPRKAMIERLGAYVQAKATGHVKPLLTGSSSNGNYYALGPTDFATIYNVLPLWQGSPAINGSGQTIAIVGSSNINIQDVRDFRSLFGLPVNDPQIIVNGVDPGVTGTVDESEADLDTEWSGAVAPNATIELVVSETTETTFGSELSAVYIIDNNLAPILSASYGSCELFLGVGGNAFYNSLWEQGAAQGITVLVAAGDGGSALCDAQSGEIYASQGLTVSGTASTPFNIALGGTDFNDVNTWSTYWSSTNNATTQASALSYIPETTWNDSCARSGTASDCANANNDTPQGIDLVAGSGGQSNCLTSTGTFPNATCTGGYPKPAWQTGSGVPDDGARDLPDVSLFASNGMNNSFYVVCQADALPTGENSCNPAGGEWYFIGAGGTSASTPAFAGIMALVDQQTKERQGNANYVLYPLAAKFGASCASTASMAAGANTSNCVFYDVQTGNNSVACAYGTPNCSSQIGASNTNPGMLEVNPPTNSSPAWNTQVGYDLATGLGSVNAANLVKNWSSVSFNPSKTTLASLSPTTLSHGQSATFTVNVAPGSGSGMPTGAVSLIAQTGTSSTNVTGIGPFTLSGGTVTSSTDMLPGGTYGVTARYAGDGTYGASDSTPPIQVTVSPEASQTHVALPTFDPVTGQETSSNATSIVYGSSLYILRVDVTNSSGQDCFLPPLYGCPTGQVMLTDNGQPLDLGSYKLNSEGYAEDQPVQLATGSHNLSASYSGDQSYNPSTSPTDSVTMNKAPTTLAFIVPSPALAGQVNFTAIVGTQSWGAAPLAPMSSLQIMNGSTQVSWSGYVSSTGGTTSGPSAGQAQIQASGTMQLPAGVASLTMQYTGDNNYAASTFGPVSVTVSDYSVSANPTSITVAQPGQSGKATITLTPLYGFTGSVSITCGAPNNTGISCAVSPSSVNLNGNSPATALVTLTTTGTASAAARALQATRRPSLPPAGRWPWMLFGLLALAALMSSAARGRRRASWLAATALLVVAIWAACGGGGGGGNPPPGQAPIASLSPSSLSFGQVNLGSGSSMQNVTLSNTGSADLNISNPTITGANWQDFVIMQNCTSNTIAAGTSCLLGVVFNPQALGSRTAALSITDNAAGSPQTVSLSGTGTQPATPAGTYNIQVLTSGSNEVHNANLTLTVQ